MEKRGLSGVVTVILIILIVLIGVAIIWMFIRPAILETLGSESEGGEIGKLVVCVELDLGVSYCGVEGDLLEVAVKRGAGELNIAELSFLIEGSAGAFSFKNDTNIPNEFGTNYYYFNITSDLGGGSVDKVSVAVILEEGRACDYSVSTSCGQGISGGGGGGGGNGPGTGGNNPPNAFFVANPGSGYAPLTVTFNASGSSDDGTIVDYSWDFGDNSAGSGEIVNHEFVNSGVYDVNLTVTDDGGLTDDYVVSVNVLASLANNECNDGEDNDGDNKTDFDDFGCWGLNGQESSTNYGWTLFEPASTSLVYFVSVDGANDNCPGYSIAELETMTVDDVIPCKTLNGARLNLRNNEGDWLLLKRGDVFEDSSSYLRSGKNGLSESYPIIFGSYGDSIVRPVVVPPVTQHGFYDGVATRQDLAIVGIHFSAPASGTSKSGIYITASDWFRNILIEDCELERFVDGMVVSGTGNNPDQGIFNLKVRNNIIIDSADDVGSARAQGAYLQHIDGLVMENNVFDHNGWSDLDPPDTQNHNVYIQDPGNMNITNYPIIRNNIFSQGAASGLQLRPGGDVYGNLFIRNAIAMHTSRKGGTIRNNVILEGTDIDAGTPRGFGILVNPTESSLVEGNIIAHRRTTSQYGRAISLDDSNNGVTNNQITIQDNIVFDWGDRLFQITDSDNSVYEDIQVLNNILQDNDGLSIVINHVPASFDAARFTYAGNKYYSAGFTQDEYVKLGGSYISWTSWVSQSGDTSTIEQTSFSDPNRGIEDYDSFIGGSGSFESFIAGARVLSKFNWNEDYTAGSVNDYIREGFDL